MPVSHTVEIGHGYKAQSFGHSGLISDFFLYPQHMDGLAVCIDSAKKMSEYKDNV